MGCAPSVSALTQLLIALEAKLTQPCQWDTLRVSRGGLEVAVWMGPCGGGALGKPRSLERTSGPFCAGLSWRAAGVHTVRSGAALPR